MFSCKMSMVPPRSQNGQPYRIASWLDSVKMQSTKLNYGGNIVATGAIMQIAIRNIGNSKGIVLPKPLLAQAGLEGQLTADIAVENGSIVLRKPTKAARAGWAEAAAVLAAEGGDVLLMGEFGNADDANHRW